MGKVLNIKDKNQSTEFWRRIGQLLAMIGSQRVKISGSVIFMIFSALATSLYAFLVGPVLKSFFSTGGIVSETIVEPTGAFIKELARGVAEADIGEIALLIIGVATAKGLFFFGQKMLVAASGQSILADLRAKIYRGFLNTTPHSANFVSTGEFMSRLSVDAQNVEDAVSLGLLASIRDVLQIISLAVLAFVLDPRLGLIGLAAFPLAALLIFRLGKEQRKRTGKMFVAFGDIGETVEETASGLQVIRSFGAEDFMERRFQNRNRILVSRVMRTLMLRAFTSPLNEILGASALAATIVYAQYQVSLGSLSPEAFLSFFTAIALLYQPVKDLSQAQHYIQSGVAALDRLELFVREGAKPHAAFHSNRKENRIPHIKIEDIRVSYKDGDEVLRGVYLELKPGTRTAVVGESGTGKTTLFEVLTGLLPVNSGRLVVDGVPMPIDPAAARSIFAPVHQEPFLFDDDIVSNVRLGRPDATDEEVEAACRSAGVTKFAEQLPDGLRTKVGRAGRSFSVGQRQRICLARALISDSPVLLFDEVTASLDGASEQTLASTLESHINSRTVLIITHRKSTALWSSELALMEGGRITEQGPSKGMILEEKIARLFGEDVITGVDVA